MLWFLNCSNLVCSFYVILEVARPTNIVYIGIYSVLTYIERLYSTVYHFLRYFCWSVNFMNRFCKFLYSFWHAWNWGKIYIWRCLVFLFVESSIPTLQYFYRLLCKLIKSLFLTSFCQLVNYMSWVFELCNIFWRRLEA